MSDIREIKVQITNTTDIDIDSIEVLSGRGIKEGITLRSLTQGVPYEELLGYLMLDRKFEVMIETCYVHGDEQAAFIPFKIHTQNIKNGKYSGIQVVPSQAETNSSSWLSLKPIKYGGKNIISHIILDRMPKQSAIIMILTIQDDPKAGKRLPEGVENTFTISEEKVVFKTRILNIEEIRDALLRDRPEHIYSMSYSYEVPYMELSAYDSSGVNATCPAWQDKTVRWIDWDELYMYLKAEGLKSLAY